MFSRKENGGFIVSLLKKRNGHKKSLKKSIKNIKKVFQK